jgi:4-hydroxy 2-oxovalerate aldolase
VPKNLTPPVYQVTAYANEIATATLGPVSDIAPIELALSAAKDLGASRILLVGFDGYPDATSAQQDLAREVQGSLDAFRRDNPSIAIESVTPTLYNVPQGSIYSNMVGAGA